MNGFDNDKCAICGKEGGTVFTRFYYNIGCCCCVGRHFETIRHCEGCVPSPPEYIDITVRAISTKLIETSVSDKPITMPAAEEKTACTCDPADACESEISSYEEPPLVGAWRIICKEMSKDYDYAWSVFCNIWGPIFDNSDNKLDNVQSNIAAAALMRHLFDYDVTGLKRYIDIVDSIPSGTSATESCIVDYGIGI